jgi:hypothetical protein
MLLGGARKSEVRPFRLKSATDTESGLMRETYHIGQGRVGRLRKGSLRRRLPKTKPIVVPTLAE